MARLEAAVVVVGGGAVGMGRAIVDVLLHEGARVVVPVPSEAAAERFYLDADPECVPRLRTAVGDPADPQTLGRIATVARREFGGIDHLVSSPAVTPPGALATLSDTDLQRALALGVFAPALLILGLMRHLQGAAPANRVVMVAGETGAQDLDAAALGRVFGDGLIALLRESAGPKVECYTLRVPSIARDTEAGSVGAAVARLLAEGASSATVDLAALVP